MYIDKHRENRKRKLPREAILKTDSNKKENKTLNTKRISSELQSVLEFHEPIFKQRRWQIGIV